MKKQASPFIKAILINVFKVWDPVELCEQAENAYDLKDFEKTIEFLDKIISKYSSYHKAFFLHGKAKSKLKMGRQAVEDFSKAIEIDNNNSLYYMHRGIEYVRYGRRTEGYRDYDTAIRLNPTYELYYETRALDSDIFEDYEGAIQDYGRLISLNPDNGEYFFSRAEIKLLNTKDYLGAVDDFTKAINVGFNVAESLNLRGLAKISLKNDTEACEDWQKASSMGNKEARESIVEFCQGCG